MQEDKIDVGETDEQETEIELDDSGQLSFRGSSSLKYSYSKNPSLKIDRLLVVQPWLSVSTHNRFS